VAHPAQEVAMTAAGLEGVVVAQTALSEVDGEGGRLIVRGHSIEELAGAVQFEEMVRLLWQGLIPLPAAPGGETVALAAALGRARAEAFARVPALAVAAADLPVMPALRLGLASLRPEPAVAAGADAAVGAAGDAILATAAMPVFAAAFARLRRGLEPVAPEPGAGQAADFLRMLRGERPAAAAVAALDAYLVTVAEHGMNASTFTARVVASTAAGVLPAVIAALSALEGPLHGGAPGPVLDMLDALATRPERRAWLRAEIAAGRRLMGFGHRIYRVRDPRADVLKREVERLRAADGLPGGGDRLALAAAVERDAIAVLAELHPGRRLDTNVEFYTALLLDALRIERSLFTTVFAMSRGAGWCAHVREQETSGRLIRPQSEYIGPRPAALAGVHG
jgi:citrate synthase